MPNLTAQVVVEAQDRTGPAIARTRKGLDSISQSLRRIQRAAAAVGVGLGFASLTRSAIATADAAQNLDNRIRTVVSSAAEVDGLRARLLLLARDTRGSFGSTVESFTRLSQALEGTGRSQDELIRIQTTLNKAVAVGGSDAQAAAGGLRQLAQAFASGTLRGDELNSVLDQLPGVTKAVIDGLEAIGAVGAGATVGTLRELAEQGKLTADVLVRALQASAADVDRQFGAMNTTIGEAHQQLGDTAQELVRSTGVGRRYADAVQALDRNLGALAQTAGLAAAGIAGVVGGRAIDSLTDYGAKVLAAARAERERRRETLQTLRAQVAETQKLHRQALASLQFREAEAGRSAAARRLYNDAVTRTENTARRAADATQNLADATRRYSGRARLAAGAARRLGIAVNFLGGPIGIVTTLLTVGVGAWLTWGRTAKAAVSELQSEIDGLIASSRGPDAVFGDAIRRQERLVDSLEERAIKATEALNDVLGRSTGRGRAVFLSRRREYIDALIALDEEEERLLRLIEARRRAAAPEADVGIGIGSVGLDPDTLTRQIEAAIRASQEAIEGLTLSPIQLSRADQRRDIEALRRLENLTVAQEAQRQAAITLRVRQGEAERAEIRSAAARKDVEERREELRRIESVHDAQEAARRRVLESPLLSTPRGAYESRLAEIARQEEAARADIIAGFDRVALRELALTTLSVAASAKRAEAAEAEADRRIRATAEWGAAFQVAVRDAQRSAADRAQEMQDAFRSAFQGATEALARFVAGGKLSFRDLADSIIADLARIAVQENITGPLYAALGNAFGGQGGGTGTPTIFNTGVQGPHGGGVAGALGGLERHGIAAAAFARAPRYHGGGVIGLRPDEVPLVARRGEVIFTPEQTRALAPAAPPAVTVEVVNRGAPVSARQEGAPRWDGSRWVVGVVLDDLSRNGPLAQGLAGRFGLRGPVG